MDGIFFYWFSWIGWVIITFFLKKTKKRVFLSGVILILIISSVHYVLISGMRISVAYLILMFTCYIYISKKTKKTAVFHLLFHSILITIATVCFQLFALYDPVWVIFDKNWMLAFMIVYLSLILAKKKQDRLLLSMVGLGQGELLLSFILHTYHFPIQIGFLSFLDGSAIVAAMIFTWNSFEYFARTLEHVIHRKQARKAGVNQ